MPSDMSVSIAGSSSPVIGFFGMSVNVPSPKPAADHSLSRCVAANAA